MARTVGWGILSTARIGRNALIPGIKGADNSTLVAVASRDEAKARTFADELGIPKAHGSYEALLADPDVDAIYIPLPNHMHLEWTTRAAEAGKHVLCEKPLTMSAAEAEQLIAVRDRTGKYITEAFMVRFHPQWHRVRELIRDGKLGDVRLIQTIFSRANADPGDIRNRAETGGGGLRDKGCYAITTARFVLGAEPERVIASMNIDPNFKVDTLASIIAEFPGGRQLMFSCATQMSDLQRVYIFGTEGKLTLEFAFTPPPDVPARLIFDPPREMAMGAETVETVSPTNQYAEQVKAFAQVVLGEAEPHWPLEDALQNMKIIDACFRSLDSGRWEKP